MTAREIADRYWQHSITSFRLEKAQALAKRSKIDWDLVLAELAKDLKESV